MANQKVMDKVVFDTKKCCGCQSCQMACSFHHQGLFQPSISSIEITNRPKEGEFAMTFYKKNADGHMACDQCKGLEVPMCVQVCPPLIQDELKGLLQMSYQWDT